MGVQQLLRRAYYASVSFFDSNFGALMDAVDSLGLADKLVVVFHSDHGSVQKSATTHTHKHAPPPLVLV